MRLALSRCDHVTDLDIPEAGKQVHRPVLVTFLEAVVLLEVVEVVSADDNGPRHLHLGQSPHQTESAHDGVVTSKGAFLVRIGALSGLRGRLEAQTDVFVVSQELLLALSSKQDPLLVLKDG